VTARVVVLALAAVLACRGTAHAVDPAIQALARDVVGVGQGVYVVAEDGTILASEAADRAVHPASVTKIATSLALLQRLGPDHRFTTRLLATGPIEAGVLRGDLVVDAGNDPFLVDEGAALILRRLHALGVRSVTGGLVVRGSLVFDWQRDPTGAAFARALGGHLGTVWPTDAPPLRDAKLTFGRAAKAGTGEGGDLLLTYRSPPLLAILKALNGYSNNVFHFASDTIGGSPAVEKATAAAVPADYANEIIIANGAGAGTVNRLSPRVAVATIDALRRELARLGRDLTAVLPVSGIDPGTLRERLLDPPAGRGIVVGKTGTYGSEGACGLAGALRTTRHGIVTFAVLNRGVAVPEARQRQNVFVGKLAAALGAEPWAYGAPAAPAFGQARIE